MRVLTIGDIVGEKAVEKIEKELKGLKQNEKIDFVIANAENAANGDGLTKKLYDRILNSGVNIITMGNHTWGNSDIYNFIENSNIIRPANCSKTAPGKGYAILKEKEKNILVINLLGRNYMQGVYNSDNPFTKVEEILEEMQDKADIILVDFHAQGSGEKFVMAYFLDGKVSAVYGTHTHVQTADEKVLPKGTGFITDIGMTGPILSSLGTDPDNDLKAHYRDMPIKDIISNNPCMINGCIFDIDEKTGKTTKVERIYVK